jgi:uncharacterized protein (TIGR02118 family)
VIKCVVLYNFPPDEKDFEDHYFGVHLPLGSKLPGLRRREFAKFTEGSGAQPPAYYRMAELYFDDRVSMERAFASEEGKAALEDREQFAKNGVKVLWAELDNLP